MISATDCRLFVRAPPLVLLTFQADAAKIVGLDANQLPRSPRADAAGSGSTDGYLTVQRLL
eukprot:SAG31_NODE_10585_length_1121_cov_1.241683_1_plen_60_part_10